MTTHETVTWSPEWRKIALNRLRNPLRGQLGWDLIIVGGGITGAGVYREAVNRGLNVLLIDQKDFAWGTSSRSSKMVHGGLRYLSSGHFGLTNHSVKERQLLMNELPGLVDPLPFIFSHYKGKFPGPWIFDKLLAIYDWMAGKRYRQYRQGAIKDYWVPGTKTENLEGVTQFSDAVTDDSRLVMRVLHEGNREGGMALNYMKAIDTLREDGKVTGLKIEDQMSGETFELKANAVINATGAWSDKLRESLGQEKAIRPLRGSHLIVPFWRLPVAFSMSIMHPVDGRAAFVFPWEGVTVIGTTDLDHKTDLNTEASVTQEEVDYLLELANHQFPNAKLEAKDIRASWSGVRPVVSDKPKNGKPHKPSDEKREHAVWDDSGLISVAGGKLTTYRVIALDVLNKAAPYIKKTLKSDAFSETTHFEQKEAFHLRNAHKQKRLVGRYGESAKEIVAIEQSIRLAGGRIGTTDTLWAELVWSCQHECVQHLDDLLLRRTRIGLLLDNGGAGYMPAIKTICNQYLHWDDARWEIEYTRYQGIIKQHYSLPDVEQNSTNGTGAPAK